jgi:hypothetical protein
MTVAFLVEVDKLIQLLESPVFTYLRLQVRDYTHISHHSCLALSLRLCLPTSGSRSVLALASHIILFSHLALSLRLCSHTAGVCFLAPLASSPVFFTVVLSSLLILLVLL